MVAVLKAVAQRVVALNARGLRGILAKKLLILLLKRRLKFLRKGRLIIGIQAKMKIRVLQAAQTTTMILRKISLRVISI